MKKKTIVYAAAALSLTAVFSWNVMAADAPVTTPDNDQTDASVSILTAADASTDQTAISGESAVSDQTSTSGEGAVSVISVDEGTDMATVEVNPSALFSRGDLVHDAISELFQTSDSSSYEWFQTSESSSYEINLASEPAVMNMLDDGETAVYDHVHDAEILKAVQDRQTSLDVSSWNIYVDLPEDEEEKQLALEMPYALMWYAAAYKHPENFYLYSYRYTYNQTTGKVSTFRFIYSDDAETEYEECMEAAAFAKSEMDKQITSDMTDLEKCLVIHDYLASTVAYDYSDYLIETNGGDYMPDYVYDMYGVLVKHSAVCRGYAEAFQYFTNIYGINCEIATSKTANHAWNLVELNGKWYHLDATWDDPVWDVYGRVKHTYFLMSSASLITDDSDKSDFVAETATLKALKTEYPMLAEGMTAENAFTEATDTTYESGQFWNKTATQTYYHDGLWYYIDTESSKDGSIYSYDFSTSVSVKLATVSSKNRWPVVGKDGYYYTSKFNKLVGDENLIYFTDQQNVYVYNITSGEMHVYFTYIASAEDDEVYLYGFSKTDGVMGYTLRSVPSASADEEVIPLTESNAPDSVHIYGSAVVTVPATCTTAGKETATCEVCGKVVETEIAATGHQAVDVAAVSAGCETSGMTAGTKCSVCGEILSGCSEIPATGHSWDAGVITKEATYTEEGVMTYTCSACSATRTETIDKLVAPEKLVPTVTIAATRGTSTRKLVFTGKLEDYANIDKYYTITGHGIVYMTAGRLGTRKLTVLTSGRTKVSFGAYKEDGSFTYTIRATSVSTEYVVRAWISYQDESGAIQYVYSDPITVSYNTAK